jgi:hypothetical protein
MGYKAIFKHPLLLGAFLGIAACALFLSAVFFDWPREKIEMAFERPRIEKALRDYFAAEMGRDWDKVYRSLAPSSIYRRTHTYAQFMDDMKSSPVRIVKYSVVGIYGLRPNHDPSAYPAVERFAQVEVDVDVGFADTNSTSTCNYCFTFIKEGGRWYKG